MTHTVKARYIVCTTLALIDLALQASWWGDLVIAEYNGVIYDLYKDGDGTTHGALMCIVAPDICEGDSIDTELRKYGRQADGLVKDCPPLESFPEIEIDPSLISPSLVW